jgi:hypothetical protein
MVKLSTREAIIGIVTYRVLKRVARRTLLRKGGIMASKKTAIFAGLGALLGALLFWRKRKARQTEV